MQALPVLSGLRRLLPDAHIAWAVEDRAAGLLEGRTDLDETIVFPRRSLHARAGRAGWHALQGFLVDLRRRSYDLVLDLQGNLKSGLIARASRARLRYGLHRDAAREGNHLFTQRRHRPQALHRVERNLSLASAALGAQVPYVPPGFPRRPRDESIATQILADSGLPPAGSYVLLHPGTSGFGVFKRWPPDRVRALAARLAAEGRTVALCAAPAEADLAAQSAPPGVAVLLAPTLPVLAALIARASLFIAADTGPLHLAAILGTPLLGLYGPKDPAVYGPYGLRPDGSPGPLPVLVRPDVACRPCRLRRCAAPLCMTTLSVEEVLSRIR